MNKAEGGVQVRGWVGARRTLPCAASVTKEALGAMAHANCVQALDVEAKAAC